MTLNEYQELAQRTSGTLSYEDKLLNGVMGLNGEAGECIDVVKKHLFQGHELDTVKLLDELGDVMWYIAQTAAGLCVEMEEIAQHNVAKLRARYPKGFEAERSVNREDK